MAALTRVRVLLVSISLGLGGAERQLALLARELHCRGVDVRVFALEAEGPWLERLKNWDVPVLNGHFGKGGGPKPIRILRFAHTSLRLASVILWYRPTIVHSYLSLANLVASVVGTLLGVRGVIISRRALGTHQDAFPAWNRLDRLTYRLSDFTICNSRAVLEDSARRDRLGREKYRVIYNGIETSGRGPDGRQREDVRAQIGLDARHTALVNVANLIPYKGHEELLTAFKSVASVYPEVRLVLAGEDRNGWKRELERLAETLAISAKVVFLGRCENVPELLRAMDLAVVSSREEGFSNALLEALEAGLPIVATDVGGNREALEDGRFGLLVPSRDSSALADGLKSVIADIGRWRQIASNAPRWVQERYSVEAMVNAHLDLYATAAGFGMTPKSSGCNQ